jgi:hypothetical protein
LPWWTELDAQQLLEEYRALQMMVMYNGDRVDSSTAEGVNAAGVAVEDVAEGPARRDQSSSKKKGGMDAELEEYLVQQVRQLSVRRMNVFDDGWPAFATDEIIMMAGCWETLASFFVPPKLSAGVRSIGCYRCCLKPRVPGPTRCPHSPQ